MKYIFFLTCISLPSLNGIAQHCSKLDSANTNGKKFLGTWAGCTGAINRQVSNCVVRRRGNEYTLQYVNYSKGVQALFYKLKGDSLVGLDKSYGNVIFIPSTGHIKWKEGEWEKPTTTQIEGAPLNK